MTQWYSIDPEHGVEIWATEAEAKAAAEAALEHYRDNASDGWHEQMEALEWGMLITHGHAKEVDRVEREDDDTGLCERIGADYRCDYVLQDCAQESLAEVLSERSEKRELEALAELDEERANVEMLKTHVETLREAWQGASEAVTKLGEQLNASEADCERFCKLLDDCRDELMGQYDPDSVNAMIHRIDAAIGPCDFSTQENPTP